MKDDRLYARFTLDFPDSPKFIALSVEAKWAYVEMVIYSRRMMTDGFLANAVALAKWGASVCLELATNDAENPSLIEVENGYQIHDFSKHQTTKSEVEDLREKRKAAGRKGGQASAKQVLKQNASKIKPETETETETETYKNSSSEVASDSRPEVESLLDLLDEGIHKNGNKIPKRTKTNRDAMRLLLDRDGYTQDQVEWIIRWCQQDQFWQANILSASKLRAKFPQLVAKAKVERNQPPHLKAVAGLSDADALDRRRNPWKYQ